MNFLTFTMPQDDEFHSFNYMFCKTPLALYFKTLLRPMGIQKFFGAMEHHSLHSPLKP